MKKIISITLAIFLTAQIANSQSCQNCGIGTNSPNAKLQVKGCTMDSTTASFNASDSNNVSMMWIQNNKRIGINTTNPRTSLHIQTSGNGGLFLNNTSGSPLLGFYLNSIASSRFMMGVDASDAKKFKIGTTAIGTDTRLTIDSTGKVGIGTASPISLLHNNSSSTDNRLYLTNSATGATTADGLVLQESSTTAYLWNYENGPLHFGTNNTTRISITSGGNVGIGISSPSNALEVVTNTPSTNGNIVLTGYQSGSNPDVGLVTQGARGTSGSPTEILSGDRFGGVYFSGYGTSFSNIAASMEVKAQENFSGTAKGTDITFHTTAKTTVGRVERMRITSEGLVGVGATSPLLRLDARGSNAKATTAAFENIFQAASTDASNPLTLRGGIKTDATAANRYGALEVDDAGTKRNLILQPSGGNVGIGTTAVPEGGIGAAKLAIEGSNGAAAGPHVQFTTASDNYPLMQLVNWTHDNVVVAFDNYYDGGGSWKSSHTGSNFQIYKESNKLNFKYASGVAQGSNITATTGISMDNAGKVGIGTTSQTAALHIKAGTSSASTAPLKFTSGTNMTTPEAGAVEYDGTSLYMTNGGAKRQELMQSQQMRVSSTYTVNNSTTLADVTGLTANVVAGKVYRFESILYTTSNSSGGIKVSIGGTSGTPTEIIYEVLVFDAGTFQTQGRNIDVPMGTGVGITAVQNAYVIIRGTIKCNATGTLTTQFAQNASHASASSVLRGSNFVITQIQ